METTLKSEFEYSDGFEVTPDVQKAFDTNGYVLIRNLLDSGEVTKLRVAVENDEGVQTQNYGRSDGAGRSTKVVLWNQPGNDITGVIARAEKVVGTFEKLLGGELYHYHAKVIMKEAFTGGKHVWHQDYGYWYENGCIFPNMGTVSIAIDRAQESNGCLQILSGSHLVGRVDHKLVGDQAGADLERVEQVKKSCPLLHVEQNPGDALFFHCNMLHTSAQNNSPNRRYAYLVAYNRADNNPVYEHHHPQYTPLNKVPNSAIMACTTDTSMAGKDYFHGPKEDTSLDKVKEKS